MLALDDSRHLLEKETSSPLVIWSLYYFLATFKLQYEGTRPNIFPWNVLFGLDNVVCWTLHSEFHFPYL